MNESTGYLTERDTLRAAMTRASEREGIPMIVVLVDERHNMVGVTDPALLETGRLLSASVVKIRQNLAPTMSDGDNGGVISALVIAAHELTEMAAARG